jgi:hypothetical protein
VYGPEVSKGQPLPSPGDIARDNGDVFTAEKGFVDREMERREKTKEDGNDQNERAKGRSLPDEEKEKERDQSRSR